MLIKMVSEKITELIYGIHPIIELLKAKRRKLTIIYTTKPTPKAWNQIEPLLPRGIQIQYVDRAVLTKMAQTSDHQGFVGYATPLVIRKKFFDPTTYKRLLMLDGIQDVGNMGAIIRSAYCTGIHGIIITKKGGAPVNAAAYKASAGLIEHCDIYYAASAASGAQELRKAGYTLYLAVLKNGVDATQVDYKEPYCLVIGSEGTGISAEILQAGERITLPQVRSDISYNASVAAGILLFVMTHAATFCRK